MDLEEPFLVVGRVQVRANVTNPSRCVVMHAGEGLDISHLNLVEPHTHGGTPATGLLSQHTAHIVSLCGKCLGGNF